MNETNIEISKELEEALHERRYNDAAKLIESGHNPNYYYDGKNTPLCRACQEYDVVAITILAKGGANPDMTGEFGHPIQYIDDAYDDFEFEAYNLAHAVRGHFLKAFGYAPDDLLYTKDNGEIIRFQPQEQGVSFPRSPGKSHHELAHEQLELNNLAAAHFARLDR